LRARSSAAPTSSIEFTSSMKCHMRLSRLRGRSGILGWNAIEWWRGLQRRKTIVLM